MKLKTHTIEVCRDAKNGQFITAKTAKRRPKSTVTETVIIKRPAPKKK